MSNNIYLSQSVEKLNSLPNGLGFFVVIGIIGFFAIILAFIITKINKPKSI